LDHDNVFNDQGVFLMPRFRCFISLLCCQGIAFAASAAWAGSNPIIVDIVNGPFSGSYQPPGAQVICLHARKQQLYSAAWRGFDVHDKKSLSEAGVEVSRPDVPGAKVGDVRVSFGDPDKRPIVYTLSRRPLTFVTKGKGAQILIEGATREGIRLRLRAACTDVEQL
jgi:hypothetical protein